MQTLTRLLHPPLLDTCFIRNLSVLSVTEPFANDWLERLSR